MVLYYVKIKSYPSSLSDEGLSIDWIEDFYEIKNANLLKVVKVIKLAISLKNEYRYKILNKKFIIAAPTTALQYSYYIYKNKISL